METPPCPLDLLIDLISSSTSTPKDKVLEGTIGYIKSVFPALKNTLFTVQFGEGLVSHAIPIDEVSPLLQYLDKLLSNPIPQSPNSIVEYVIKIPITDVKQESYEEDEFLKFSKKNKKLIAKNKKMIEFRKQMGHCNKLARQLLSSPGHNLISLDVEAYERNQKFITEVGFTIYNSSSQSYKSFHHIIEENKWFRNGRYVPDHRDRFQFGTSEFKSLKESIHQLKGWINCSSAIVGHSIHSDFKLLSTFGIHNNGKHNPPVIDTQTLWIVCNKGSDQPSLKKVLHHLGIEFQYLHNAGNDAYHTMQAFVSLATLLPPKN